MTDAFDADVLVYAATGKPAGATALSALRGGGGLLGSVILLPETLSKPLQLGDDAEGAGVTALLALIDLKPVDLEIARAATTLAAKYRLKAADAIHLATAVVWGAERFHTNNSKDFGPHITEVEVVWPVT